MKKLYGLIITCVIVSICFGQGKADVLDSVISTYAGMQRFNGTVLVASHGKILLNKGYGYRNVAEKIPNTENSIFQLGSITKQFTGAVILKLREERKLDVSDKISKYFPDFPKGDSITIEHLLLHTSGIFNYTDDANFMKNEVSKPKTRDQMMALFKDKPLDFSPGTQWSYSNSGYSLLGYIIEAVTKDSYEHAVYKYIFNPLKMNHSGFDFTHLNSPDKTTGYLAIKDQHFEPAVIVDSSVSFSAGSIYSTTGDLYKWHSALQGNKMLSTAQKERAYLPVKNNYGYGWVIDSIEGKRRVGHGGGIPGYITNESRVPEDDICIVLLSNASDRSLEEITKNIYAVLYDQPYELPKIRKAVTLPLTALQQYVGEYELAPGFTVIMSIKGAGLGALPTGQSEKIILPEKEDLFFENENDVQIEFTRNDKKEVTGFILHQNGRQINSKKIK
jgi:CubicO group peptidase (beta-lactamase class C family)